MKAYIKSISYYLPERILTNEDIAKAFPEWQAQDIEDKVGISQRHIALKEQTAGDLAVEAANMLFSRGIDKGTIDYILFCTQSPTYKLPTTACIIQNALGLSTSCGALDFNLGCSGFVYGLSLAKGLIVGGMAKNVLLLTAETYSKYIAKDDKANMSLFGDAASATLISTSGCMEIQDFAFGTDGAGYENLIVKKNKLFMDGPTIFSFTLKQVPKLLENVFAINNTKMEDIDLFIFHQANKYILEHLRKKLKIPCDKFFLNLKNIGNTVSSSIPIAIKDAINQNKIKSNSTILLAGFGVGLSWAGCQIIYN